MVGSLSRQDVHFFAENGYLCLPDAVSESTIKALITQAECLVDAFQPGHEFSVFSTQEGKQDRDRYFMESGDKIRFFFEEEALDDQGRLLVPKQCSINKIGHALHRFDPVFRPFSQQDQWQQMARVLGQKDPFPLQSMYIFKQPGIGGEVTCHQDGTFLFTDPPSVLGFWFALEHATQENGCLWALPGGHRAGLRSRYVRKPEGGTTFHTYDATPWPVEGLVRLEVPAGTLVLLHGCLPHMSFANRSKRSRHAYALHFIDDACRYPEDNWLQR